MFQAYVKLFSIILLNLFIYNNFVKSSEINTESDYDYENQTFNYQTESSLKPNSSDDSDYDELIEDNDCKEKSNFFERLKLIHNEGKNITISKHVKHINQTFDLIKNATNTLKSLFPTDGRAELELLEFLSEIDLQLSSQCSKALFTIRSSVKNLDLWALKCKFKVEICCLLDFYQF